MAGSQISTSVTIIDSLHGFQAISLTEYATSAAAAIAAGSVVEIAGAFFTFSGDEAIEASTWTSITTGNTAYIALTAAGTAGTQTVTARYTSTAPTWRDDFQGWYASAASSVRVIGSVYKAEATRYIPKYLLDSTQDYRTRGVVERITTGAGNWTVPAGVTRIKVTCVGGGGGGGGAAAGALGGGGGGGTSISNAIESVVSVIPGSLIAYSVGAGGSAGPDDTAGGTGGDTTFTGATTGKGGLGGSSGTNGGQGGQGANIAGVAQPGSSCGSHCAGASAGRGGTGGGAGGVGGAPTQLYFPSYGGGGGGGCAATTVPGTRVGQAGGSGIIIIEY